MMRVVLALGFIGALTLGACAGPAQYQYYDGPRDYDAPRDYQGPRDYDGRRDYDGWRDYEARRDYDAPQHYDGPRPDHDHHHGDQTWNGCPRGWTVQGGNCAPYKGPVGGGRPTWNGCPPNYTIQGGECKPYIGPR
jgi:hypothetical protein